MSEPSFTNRHSSPSDFDLFRLTKSKEAVDICPNSLRSYHAEGLPFYRRGRAVFVSKSDLQAFIRARSLIKHSTLQQKAAQ